MEIQRVVKFVFCDKKIRNQVDFWCVVYKIAKFVVALI